MIRVNHYNRLTKVEYAQRRVQAADSINTKMNLEGRASVKMLPTLAIELRKQMKRLNPELSIVIQRDPESKEAILVAVDPQHPAVKNPDPKGAAPVSIFKVPLKDRPGFQP
jgi:hypothetical protein